MAREKHYGIKVRGSNGRWETYWFGTDKAKRNREHNRYAAMPDVLVVKDVEMKV